MRQIPGVPYGSKVRVPVRRRARVAVKHAVMVAGGLAQFVAVFTVVTGILVAAVYVPILCVKSILLLFQ